MSSDEAAAQAVKDLELDEEEEEMAGEEPDPCPQFMLQQQFLTLHSDEGEEGSEAGEVGDVRSIGDGAADLQAVT